MVAKTLAGRWKLPSIISAVLAEFQLKFNLPFVYLESWTKLLPENNNWAKTSFRADNNFQVHYLINNEHARSRSLLSRTRNQTSDKLKSDTNYQRLRISRPRTKSTNWRFFWQSCWKCPRRFADRKCTSLSGFPLYTFILATFVAKSNSFIKSRSNFRPNGAKIWQGRHFIPSCGNEDFLGSLIHKYKC